MIPTTGQYKDLAWSYEGDLQFFRGDVRVMVDTEFMARMAVFWTLTEKGSWPLYPRLGTTFRRYIGRPNTEFTQAMLIDEMNADMNSNNFFGIATYAVNLDYATSYSIFMEMYVLIDNISIQLFDINITDTIINTFTPSDPFDMPAYFPLEELPWQGSQRTVKPYGLI